MKVDVKFVCPEIVGPLRSGAYDVPENITISELLEICSSECFVPPPENIQFNLLILINGKPALPDAKLSDGDQVHVLRKVFAG